MTPPHIDGVTSTRTMSPKRSKKIYIYLLFTNVLYGRFQVPRRLRASMRHTM